MQMGSAGAIHLQRFAFHINNHNIRRIPGRTQVKFPRRRCSEQDSAVQITNESLNSSKPELNTQNDPALSSSNEAEPLKFYAGDNVVQAPTEIMLHDGTSTSLSGPTIVVQQENEQQVEAADLISDDINMIEQLTKVFAFAGPALGIWLSGPIMSLIDTSVVGMSSSIELAALGPGTVVCDGTGYVFTFLSVATSNLIATSLANKDMTEAANHLARLLFVALACGVFMFTVIKLGCNTLLRAFVGQDNLAMIPAASSYVNIRAFAWPVVLITMVGQSACLGMQDSRSPLKVLAVCSAVNAIGDILLCTFLGYGIAGAAWATMVAQHVAGFLMLKSLQDKGFDPFALAVPRMEEFIQMIQIAAPVLLTMLFKVGFYTTITFFATSLGAVTLAAHQVMIGIYTMFSVVGEPLAQTAQSFMPELLYGKRPSLKRAQNLLKTLVVSGALLGFGLATTGIVIPYISPQLFTKDSAIIAQMHSIAVPFWCSIMLTPPTLALEGALLAVRDYGFLSLSMVSCFLGGGLLMLLFRKLGYGLKSCWWMLVLFQLTRFVASFSRLNSAKSTLKASWRRKKKQ